MSIQKKFGLKVKELRLEKDLSQEKLAEISNLHRTYKSSIELGNRNVSLINIEKIANALEFKINAFFN